MDLIDGLEGLPTVGREKARQPWGEGGTHDHRDLPLSGLGSELEEPGDVDEVVRAGDHGDATAKVSGCGLDVGSSRPTEKHRIDLGGGAGGRGVEVGDGTERRAHRRASFRVDLPDGEPFDAIGRGQLASGPGAHRTSADQQDRRHRRSGPDSSRQPPPWGGVPPEPRTRKKATTAAAAPRAMRARRSKVMDISSVLESGQRKATTQWQAWG